MQMELHLLYKMAIIDKYNRQEIVKWAIKPRYPIRVCIMNQ